MTFKKEPMTYKRYLTLKVLGFLENDHSHVARVVLNTG